MATSKSWLMPIDSSASRAAGIEEAERIVAAFLDTPFAGGRHQQRVAKIGRLDDRSHPATAS